jgi:hypothetical protein
VNNIEGKIMVDQLLKRKDHVSRDLQSIQNIHEIITTRDINDSLRLLSYKIEKLNSKLDDLIEDLNSKVALGDNGTTLEPNGEIK